MIKPFSKSNSMQTSYSGIKFNIRLGSWPFSNKFYIICRIQSYSRIAITSHNLLAHWLQFLFSIVNISMNTSAISKLIYFGIFVIMNHEWVWVIPHMINFIIFSFRISGVMYQVAAEITVTKQNKLRSNIDVLAGGYRYDKLVSYMFIIYAYLYSSWQLLHQLLSC